VGGGIGQAGEETDEIVVAEAVTLVEAALRAHPAALRPMMEPVQRLLSTRLGGGCAQPERLRAAATLALLPRVMGTAAAWGALSRRCVTPRLLFRPIHLEGEQAVR
jgi:hypothetical protein